MKASYPDPGSVRDSNEGGPEELEEVVDEVGEGALIFNAGWRSWVYVDSPPQKIWPCTRQPLG